MTGDVHNRGGDVRNWYFIAALQHINLGEKNSLLPRFHLSLTKLDSLISLDSVQIRFLVNTRAGSVSLIK
jgi:hypothetical protein